MPKPASQLSMNTNRIEAIIENEGSPDSVFIEDDGEVAFAYFRKRSREITGFVWLYNRARAPEDLIERSNSSPPLNPSGFVSTLPFVLPSDDSEFEVHWLQHRGVWQAAIYIRNRIHAIVGDGDVPGWCILASRDGPIARILELPEVLEGEKDWTGG
jgi:hypothetical protein